MAMELFAEELTAAQVSYACGLITFAADIWDDELKRSFGGETYFEGNGVAPVADPPPGTAPTSADADDGDHASGYL
jgi:hypothetical protein